MFETKIFVTQKRPSSTTFWYKAFFLSERTEIYWILKFAKISNDVLSSLSASSQELSPDRGRNLGDRFPSSGRESDLSYSRFGTFSYHFFEF